MDQISIAPCLPRRSFLMISGDMYIGVPVKLFIPGGLLAVLILGVAGSTLVPFHVRCTVFEFFARILAAPKSTNLMTPRWSSRISARPLDR